MMDCVVFEWPSGHKKSEQSRGQSEARRLGKRQKDKKVLYSSYYSGADIQLGGMEDHNEVTKPSRVKLSATLATADVVLSSPPPTSPIDLSIVFNLLAANHLILVVFTSKDL
jgi:hypothetical protein